MSTIIELLTHTENRCGYFQVDTSQEYVNIQYDVNAIFQNVDEKQLFIRGDNFQILSFMVQVPYCFRIWDGEVGFKPLYTSLSYWEDEAGAIETNFTELYIPFINYEMNQGNFYNFPTTKLKKGFRLMARLNGNNKISMYNVPSEWHLKTFYTPIYIKIRHNLPLE